MLLDELVPLIHAADAACKGCSVMFTTVNVPPSSRGGMFGIVTWGTAPNQATFHDEGELRRTLERLAKR